MASYTVTPNQETPKGCLSLSDSDQIGRWTHVPTIYIYKGKHNCDVIERIRDSLSKILVDDYPLAGRLSWIEGGRLKLDCNAKGATLLEAETIKALAEYGDFSPKEPIKELIPKVDYSQPIEEIPLLLVQVTRFHGDEGVAVGVAYSHPLSDGLAAIRFINAWAKVARGDTLDPKEMPFLDRTVLKYPHPPPTPTPHFDHPEHKPLPLILGSSDNTAEKTKETTVALLKLAPDQVEKLKRRANTNGQSQTQGLRPYSRYEVLGAHIWRCASKARELKENQPTVVRFNGDIRSKLNPPLPQNYFGNALAATVTPTCCVGDIISQPLSYAAQKIREAVDMLTDEYIRSQLISLCAKSDWISLGFPSSKKEIKGMPRSMGTLTLA